VETFDAEGKKRSKLFMQAIGMNSSIRNESKPIGIIFKSQSFPAP
jgi:hypothetical protein